jgi:hypothetical protein
MHSMASQLQGAIAEVEEARIVELDEVREGAQTVEGVEAAPPQTLRVGPPTYPPIDSGPKVVGSAWDAAYRERAEAAAAQAVEADANLALDEQIAELAAEIEAEMAGGC